MGILQEFLDRKLKLSDLISLPIGIDFALQNISLFEFSEDCDYSSKLVAISLAKTIGLIVIQRMSVCLE